MKKHLALIIFFLTLVGCQKEYNAETCNQLSMKAFKGSPTHANEFQKNCQDIEITYTEKRCKQALNDLIMTGSLAEVKDAHGEDVAGCFTENDLKTFAK